MGEAKIKNAQTFKLSMPGRGRHVLWQIFSVGTASQLLQMAGEKPDEKGSPKELGEWNRAWDALKLDDFDLLRSNGDEEAWLSKLDTMDKLVCITAENVRVIRDQITAGQKVVTNQGPLVTGRGLRRLMPVVQLLDECKEGKHALPETLDSDSATE